MRGFPRIMVSRLVLLTLCVPALMAQTQVRQVKVLSAQDAVEIEVETSDRVVPQTQVLTGPDRLVVDFPNAVPGSLLHSQSVDRGEVKDIRVGLFQAKPPVTRVVLDLKAPESYQVFPYGRTVMIKVTGGAPDASAGVDDFPPEEPTRPGFGAASYTAGAERIHTGVPLKPLEVSFRDGLLTIRANKATLSEVLLAVQQRTGADISLAPGAEQEKVVIDMGPAPAPQVLAELLKGSRFNFLILSATSDPRQLDRVILSPRGEGIVVPLPAMTSAETEAEERSVPASAQPHVMVSPPPAAEIGPGPQPEIPLPGGDDPPNQ